MPLAIYDFKNKISTITFNRNDKRNAFNKDMCGTIIEYINKAQDDQASLIVLRATKHASVWSAGHDLSELKAGEDFTKDPLQKMFDAIVSSPLPVISMVEGNVFAGGFLLLLFSDMVIASSESSVAMTANKMGVPFATPYYSYCLKTIGLHKTKELFFTASSISAHNAQVCGIFNHVMPKDCLEWFVYDILAPRIIACVPEGIANSKLQLNTLAMGYFVEEEEKQKIDNSCNLLMHAPQLQMKINALLNHVQHKEDKP